MLSIGWSEINQKSASKNLLRDPIAPLCGAAKGATPMKELLKGIAAPFQLDEPMAPYTSLKIGGKADLIVYPQSVSELSLLRQAIASAGATSFVLGKGSNLLVQDGGIRGVVISLKHLNRMEREGHDVIAEAGVSFPRLAIYAMEAGLSGLEFAIGIPGTVGGAVAMNAGISGMETGSFIETIRAVDSDGQVGEMDKGALEFGYRSASLRDRVVVSARFHLTPAPRNEIELRMKEHLEHRRKKQPLAFFNAGSIFKNPPGQFAGEMIERAGLKGYRMGKAEVSAQHANFIVNRGAATARNVLDLIAFISESVQKMSGITLALEIKIVGNEP